MVRLLEQVAVHLLQLLFDVDGWIDPEVGLCLRKIEGLRGAAIGLSN